jgi:hypothetical protein
MKRRTSLTRWMLITLFMSLQLAALPGWVRPAQAEDNSNPCLTPNTPGCSFGLPTYQYEMLLGQITAHPTPNVRPLSVDITEIKKYSYYKVTGGSLTLYDKPDGAPVETVDPGFNYFDVKRRDGDWAEVLPGRWAPRNQLVPVRASTFTGVLIDQPLAYQMAWVLITVRPSQIPGIKADPKTPPIPRYTRLNIFTVQKVGKWEWYLVGPGQWVEQRMVARIMPAQKPAEVKGRWIAVDLYEQVLVAYDEDRMVFATLIASGLPKWNTNEGLFKIWTRLRLDNMSGAMGRPDFYCWRRCPM